MQRFHSQFNHNNECIYKQKRILNGLVLYIG